MFLAVCFYILFHIPIVRADGWDDFSNNLATDLAPLLSLFGEQITKQYLSESITLLDNFIFAMAPIGILTAVVSTIRVCGSPSLRAFIGRAQEGKGIAEAELCSSTSRDVCELYNNGGIARVFGRPKIIEIVHVPDDPEFENTAGIYTFQKYLESSRGGEEWEPKNELDPERSEAVAPNLSLNVGIKRRPRFAFWTVATIGFILQAGVLVFAVIATYVLQWDKDGNRPDSYACPLAVTGTIMVCAGCFLCAFLVGQSTDERSFRRKSTKSIYDRFLRRKSGTETTKKPSSIYWVQPGGQTLGDQIFDPFCYSDNSKPLDEYITSWKNTSQKWTKTSEIMVWVAVGITISGFILQFVGLRGIHSAISVAQLGAVMVMSAARAALRMQRLGAEDNYLRDRPDEVVGHELDWLALQIGERETCSKDRLFWRFCTSNGILQSRPLANPASSSNLDVAAKLLIYRTRLAELTQSPTSHSKPAGAAAHFEVEMVEVRQSAIGLVQAMESAVNTIYSKAYGVLEKWEAATSMYWSFSCNVGSPALDTLSLKLTRERLGGPWILQNKQQLEAILGLWAWSLTADKAVEISDQHSKLILSRANDIPARRIITTNQYISDSDWKIWFGSMAPDVLEDELYLDSIECCSASTIWRRDKQQPWERALRWERGQNWDLCTTYKTLLGKLPNTMEDVVRFVGWPAAEPPQCGPFKKLQCRSAPTNTSLLSLCAQEVFGSFVKDILNLVSDFGVTRAAKETEHFRPESALASDLMSLFIDNNLGSRRDASLCILPPLIPHLMRSSARDTLIVARKSADQYRKDGEWDQAERVLKWAWRQCRNYSPADFSSVSSSEVPLRNDHCQAASIALFELYRWALRDGKKRDFGYSGIKRLASKHHPVSAMETVDRYMQIAECINRPPVDGDGGQLYSRPPIGSDLTSALIHITQSDPSKTEQGRELLCSAARFNWVEVVLALCELGTTPDFEDSQSRTALSHAAGNGNVELVKELMSAGALPNSTDGKHRTPLSYAAEIGSNDVVKVLLSDQLLDLNLKDDNGRTPLAIAAENGHDKTIQMLLDTGKVRPDEEDNDTQTPLSRAIYAGYQKVVQVLLKKGADIDLENERGMTWLARASSDGQKDVVQRLLAYGAKIESKDHKGRTPLLWAALNGHVDTVELLLEKGAQIDSKDNDGVTPLGHAHRRGHVFVVKLLLDKEEATNMEGYGSKSLLWAVTHNYVTVVDHLLNNGADIELKNHLGQTPLCVAVDGDKEAMVKLLLDKGANAETPSNFGDTPWTLAWTKKNSNVVGLFKDKYPYLSAPEPETLTDFPDVEELEEE